MSKQAWSTFKQKLAEDESLRSEMARVLGASGKKATASVEELVEFGRIHGYEFSADDLHDSSELGDQELSAVAGGVLGGSSTLSYKEQRVFNLESLSFNFAKIETGYKY